MTVSTLCVETAQMRNVPRIMRKFACLRVLHSICASTKDLRDDERTFPWGSELVHLLLLQSKNQVAHNKGPGSQSTAMVVAEILLVNSCAGQGRVSRLIEQVDCVFECFFPAFLIICFNSWRIEPYI